MSVKYVGAALAFSAAGLLAACSVGASGNASSTIFSGSVSAGAPLTDGLLIVMDSSTPAKTFTQAILADGTYSVDTANGVAPFLFRARGRVESRTFELFSASAANSGKVNISPLTSLVVANAAGKDCAVTSCTPAIFTAAALTKASAIVHTQIVPLLTQLGLAIADTLDSTQRSPAITRKWVFFKHIAVGGYVFSRDGPLEFVKDASGNWRMASGQEVKSVAKRANIYAPPSGASSFGTWLPLSTDSSAYPEGATLITVSGSGITPSVNLVYADGDSGSVKIAGPAMVEAVTGVSFLPACPRPVGQDGSCIDVAQTGSYVYSAAFNDPAAAIPGPAGKISKKKNTLDVISPATELPVIADSGSQGRSAAK